MPTRRRCRGEDGAPDGGEVLHGPIGAGGGCNELAVEQGAGRQVRDGEVLEAADAAGQRRAVPGPGDDAPAGAHVDE